MFVDFLSSSTRFSTKWILSLGNSGSFYLNFRPFSSRVSISSLSSLLDSGPSFAIFYMTLAVHLRRFILSFFLYVSHIHFILCLYVCFDIYIFLFGLHCYLLMILMMDDCMCVDWWFVGVVGVWNLFKLIRKCFNFDLYLRICSLLRGDFAEIFAFMDWLIYSSY